MNYGDWQIPKAASGLELIYCFFPCQIIHLFRKASIRILIVISVFQWGWCRGGSWKADPQPEMRAACLGRCVLESAPKKGD